MAPDGTAFVSGANAARVWDGRTGKILSQDLRHTEKILLTGFSQDGTRLITGSSDGTVKEWDCRVPNGDGRTLGEWVTAFTGAKLHGTEFMEWIATDEIDSTCEKVDAYGNRPLTWDLCLERLGRPRTPVPPNTK